MTEISGRYRDLAGEFTRRVDAVPTDRWESPSPCAGWSTRDVVHHVIDTHRTMPGYAGLSLSLKEPVDDDPRSAWAEARDAMQELLDDPDRAGLEYDGYFGRTTLQDTVDRFRPHTVIRQDASHIAANSVDHCADSENIALSGPHLRRSPDAPRMVLAALWVVQRSRPAAAHRATTAQGIANADGNDIHQRRPARHRPEYRRAAVRSARR